MPRSQARNKGSSMMDIEHLSIEANPTFEDVRFLEDRLYKYNGSFPPIQSARSQLSSCIH